MAATYLLGYLAIYHDSRMRLCAKHLYTLGSPLRWGGIIVKTSLNVIDMASSLVRAVSLRGSSTRMLSLSFSISERLEDIDPNEFFINFTKAKNKKSAIYYNCIFIIQLP